MNSILISLIYWALILVFISSCERKENVSAEKDIALQEISDTITSLDSKQKTIGTSDLVFKTEHMWDAKVTIAEGLLLGESKRGWRRIVPITGGTFEGPSIRGEVVAGGEDWQLTRQDGDTELYARYLLKTHDGHLIQVINRVLMHFPPKGEKGDPYIRSVIDLEAPNDSPYEYLNHAIFLGTLTEPRLKAGEEPYVIIGVYKVL